jgi:hypothetical protein
LKRGTLIKVVGAAAAATTLGVVAGVLATRHDERREGGREVVSTIGTAGGTVRVAGLEVAVPPAAVRQPVRLVITTLGSAPARAYGGATTPGSPTFRIRTSGRLRAPVVLRFSDPRIGEARQVVAARRPDGATRWELVHGRRDGDTLEVTTRHFSDWQLRVGDVDLAAALSSAQREAKQIAELRSDPPACEIPAGATVGGAPDVTVDDSGKGDPLVHACLEQRGGTPALRVRSNRGVGLEFDLPGGVEIAEIRGRSLGEAAFDELNSALSRIGPTGNGRLLPGGGGEVLLTGDLENAPVTFRIATTGLVTDAVLALAPKEETVDALIDAATCGWRSGSGVDKPSVSSLKDLIWDCAQAGFSAAGKAAAASAMSLPKVTLGLTEVLADFGRSAKVTVAAQEREPGEDARDPLVSAGASCGRVAATGYRGAKVGAELVVVRGRIKCSFVRSLWARYWDAMDAPCDRLGAGTCWREFEGWSCVVPTAGASPKVFSCFEDAGRGEVVGYD